ncbi:MAG: DedA family protein [Alphaproteobacteria bacterium]|nr:DedA family protein [Alphaproteobacteria bacterium]NDC56647.1 DedA family protein [Alphaproteobacteria bacterium]NDG04543.1 DedA family protein [Alphaproteobacteria bacterium]
MSFFRPLYDKVLKLSGTRHAPHALAAVSFAESSVFPIPPDVLLLPMCMARPGRAYVLALICTVSSVLGAFVGYAIGALLLETVGQWLMAAYGWQEKLVEFQQAFQEWGVAIILAKGLTPIPFKLVTLASGVAHLPFLPFMLACVVTRGARFFLVAALAKHCGVRVQPFVEKYLTWVMLALLAAIVLGFWLVVGH